MSLRPCTFRTLSHNKAFKKNNLPQVFYYNSEICTNTTSYWTKDPTRQCLNCVLYTCLSLLSITYVHVYNIIYNNVIYNKSCIYNIVYINYYKTVLWNYYEIKFLTYYADARIYPACMFSFKFPIFISSFLISPWFSLNLSLSLGFSWSYLFDKNSFHPKYHHPTVNVSMSELKTINGIYIKIHIRPDLYNALILLNFQVISNFRVLKKQHI